jgi:hypothetical protein
MLKSGRLPNLRFSAEQNELQKAVLFYNAWFMLSGNVKSRNKRWKSLLHEIQVHWMLEK